MRLVAFVAKPASVKPVLLHLGLPAEVTSPIRYEARRLGLLMGARKRILIALSDSARAASLDPPAAPSAPAPAREAERRQLTVMFCELVDSTTAVTSGSTG